MQVLQVTKCQNPVCQYKLGKSSYIFMLAVNDTYLTLTDTAEYYIAFLKEGKAMGIY